MLVMRTVEKKPLMLLVALLASLCFQNVSQAQSDEDQIKAVINTMFDGMREGDSTKVHSVFSDEVVMKTIARNRESGELMVRESLLQNFLNAVGTPHDNVWNEKVLSFKINIDGPMATAWTPYEFYSGEKFSHCGVNNFTLFNAGSGWKIIYLIDTRRREGCK